MELNAETRSVNEIFSPNKKYIVPRFQREYSWESEEIEEFWEDVVQQIRVLANGPIKNEEYFIGCIVLVGEDAKPEYQIVDGQQRITTLTIFLRIIVERLVELGEVAAANALFNNVIEGTDNDGNKYFKLVNESPKPFFQNEIQAITPQGLNEAQTDEEILLKNAVDIFRRKIADYKIPGFNAGESLRALRDQVLNYLKFILVTAKNEDDAYTIFETLNARGVSLSSVDLIKNWIFKNYNQTHPNDNAKDLWNDLRKSVNSFADLETFFRHYWNSRYAIASNARLYTSFKEFLKAGKIPNARGFLLELKEAAAVYRMIGAPVDSDWRGQKEKAVKRSLDLLNAYDVTLVRPYLLALLQCRQNKSIDQTTFITAIENIENFHFIFSSVCQDRASGLEGKYTRAAKNMHSAGNDKAAVKNVVKELCNYLATKRPTAQRISESVAVMAFTDANARHKKAIQNMFVKIEHSLHATSELSVRSFSIEHIDDQSGGKPWAGSVGNLLPLDEGLNNGIKPGTTYKHKKSVYQNSQFKIVKHYISKNPSDVWDEAAAKSWEAELVDLLEKATRLRSI